MVWTIHATDHMQVNRKYQIVYDVELDVAGEPSYKWLDVDTGIFSEYSLPTAREAADDYREYWS